MNPKYLILSLDFDGCSDRPFSQKEIIQHTIKTCLENPTIESIYLIIGSLRQTPMLDVGNAQRNSTAPHFISCTTLYNKFLPELNRCMSKLEVERIPSVHFCPLLMNDIYNHFPTGSTFKAMQDIFAWPFYIISHIRTNTHTFSIRNQHDESINVLSHSSNKEIADCSKVTIIYTQLHHFAKHLDAAPILMHFYDDRLDILEGLRDFYSRSPELMPENMHLELIHLEAIEECKSSLFTPEPIKGQGATNPDYHELMYQMALYHEWESIPDDFDKHKAIFEELLSRTLPKTHDQSFEVYSVPVLEEPKPTAAITPVPKEESTPLEYQEIIVPDVLSENMSIYDCYQNIMTQTSAIYQKKLKDLEHTYQEDIDFLDYRVEYPDIFQLAYELERNQRQLILDKEILQMQTELEDLLSIHDDEFRLDSDCKLYANIRCDYEEKQCGLKYAFEAARHEKIRQLARYLKLSPQTFIERMERHKLLLQTPQTIFAVPKPRRAPTVIISNDDNLPSMSK
jgi:hypothetical protein